MSENCRDIWSLSKGEVEVLTPRKYDPADVDEIEELFALIIRRMRRQQVKNGVPAELQEPAQ